MKHPVRIVKEMFANLLVKIPVKHTVKIVKAMFVNLLVKINVNTVNQDVTLVKQVCAITLVREVLAKILARIHVKTINAVHASMDVKMVV